MEEVILRRIGAKDLASIAYKIAFHDKTYATYLFRSKEGIHYIMSKKEGIGGFPYLSHITFGMNKDDALSRLHDVAWIDGFFLAKQCGYRFRDKTGYLAKRGIQKQNISLEDAMDIARFQVSCLFNNMIMNDKFPELVR